jgi:hypothetical protein
MAKAAVIAEAIFRAAADGTAPGDAVWLAKVEHLSQLCESGGASTHIAFLVTSMLARAVNGAADLYAVKPAHAGDNPDAYSARTLCHGVVVPLAAELGVNIGVSGREPLNNQPYFRMRRLDDGTPVAARARPAFDFMLSLVAELNGATSKQAQEALRAFIVVRRRYQTVYTTSHGALSVTWATLPQAIALLVAENSEGGRRAQAAVAGLFDVFAGAERVESGRINDPSRHYPGDVAVLGYDGRWEKAVEVRDKHVTDADVYIFARNCLAKGVRDAAVMLAHPYQARLNEAAIAQWGASSGIGLTLFYGWEHFVDQVLFWANAPRTDGAAAAVERIEARLIGVEASPDAVRTWQRLTRR